MLYINNDKPKNPKGKVTFYTRLIREMKICKFDTLRMHGYTITTIIDDFLERRDGKKVSKILLKESFEVIHEHQVQEKIHDAIQKILLEAFEQKKDYAQRQLDLIKSANSILYRINNYTHEKKNAL
ncbi:hypothetical protein [Bernardetia sp. MNP-M8]|uniref:hypothetical protein n=1 Tax=Bernardetia sp. MNP-M8 TaxID=3127470 RepID=UPI0030D265F8